MTLLTSGLYGHEYQYRGKKTICHYWGEIAKDGMHYMPINAYGKAVCSPEDVYDEDFGKCLAAERALQNFHKKVEKEFKKVFNL